MRRLPLMAGAAGLLILTSVPAFAGQPARAAVTAFSTPQVTDPCLAAASGSPLGRVQINRRGKSSKSANGNYKVQVKVNDVAPSTSYDLRLFTVTTLITPDPVTGATESCTEDTSLEAVLVTDTAGEGVVNVKHTALSTSRVRLLLDAPEGPAADLGTASFAIEPAKKTKKTK